MNCNTCNLKTIDQLFEASVPTELHSQYFNAVDQSLPPAICQGEYLSCPRLQSIAEAVVSFVEVDSTEH